MIEIITVSDKNSFAGFTGRNAAHQSAIKRRTQLRRTQQRKDREAAALNKYMALPFLELKKRHHQLGIQLRKIPKGQARRSKINKDRYLLFKAFQQKINNGQQAGFAFSEAIGNIEKKLAQKKEVVVVDKSVKTALVLDHQTGQAGIAKTEMPLVKKLATEVAEITEQQSIKKKKRKKRGAMKGWVFIGLLAALIFFMYHKK